jgi:cobaltochelatase CobT
VRVIFRGFQPCVATHPKTGEVMYMVLPEVGDNASAELVEAMQGFLDHECGHIFFTPFKRTSELLAGLKGGERKLLAAMLNIVEDIRLEKLLPRELPGTKDNLERTYDAVMERFWGKPMRELTKNGGDAQQLLGIASFQASARSRARRRSRSSWTRTATGST